MSRYSEADPGFTFFEDRADLPEIFDPRKPDNMKWGFELPRDVDFYVHLGIHGSREDFARADALITPDTDLFLGEGVGSEWLEFFFDEMCEGSKSAYDECARLIRSTCPSIFLGHQLALLESLNIKKTAYRILDPPKSHKSYDELAALINHENDYSLKEEYCRFSKISHERDVWALHNIKNIVDSRVPFTPDVRRQVVISRGIFHMDLLRALEYQTEYNPKKANGSVVVASTVDVVSSDGTGMLTELIKSIEPEN